MSDCRKILLLTGEANTAHAVAAALKDHDQFTTNGTARNLQELVSQLQGHVAPAALVDIDGQAERILGDLEHIVAEFPETRFVVLSSELRSEWLLASIQAGARHYLLKKSIATDLAPVLTRLSSDLAGNGLGTLVTVLGASGGCGVTTVAVNLAYELQQVSTEPTLLVDLDVAYGGLAAYLGASGRYGIADVMAHEGHIDADLIRSTAVECGPGLGMLISPATANFQAPTAMDYSRLSDALEACRRASKYVVVDGGRAGAEVASTLAAHSQMTIVLFQLNVKDIRHARSIMAALAERGVPADRIVPMASRWHRRSPVSLADACRALSLTTIDRIENDFRSAISAMNYGQPLRKAAPRSGLMRDMRKLALRVSND
jgi:pilus assembly protein CpaE